MKIFFVNPPFKAEHGKFAREARSPSIGRSGYLYYPLWLIYAAAVVQEEGFEVHFLDAPAKPLNEERSLEDIERRGDGTRLFVLGTSTPSIYSDVAFGAELKRRYPKSFVLLVGTHPSALPAETLEMDSGIDGVARREYDYIVRDLAFAIRDGAPLETVKGISYRKDGVILHNPNADYIEDLDAIPFASKFIKEHLCERDYFFPAATFPMIQVFTGRGCPARCTFCVYPQTMHGHKYRMRSAQNVIEEFKYIAENFGDVKEIVIEDDTFTIDKQRTLEICRLLIDNKLHKRFRWLCNARVNLDLETMKMMKKAGCRLIIPGFESLNQTVLNNIKKGTTIEEIKRYVSNAKKAGLLVHACYMAGNKGDTKDTLRETLEMAKQFKTDTAQFFSFNPYPGTEAYEWVKSNGYIEEDYRKYCKEDGTLNCIVNLPGLSSQELLDFCIEARRAYYLRPWYFLHRLWMGLTDIEDFKRAFKAFLKFRTYLFKDK